MGEAKANAREKVGRGSRRGPRLFIRAAELAHHFGCDIRMIHRRVADGSLPPPHSTLGPSTSLWLRGHFDAYVKDGRWPEAAYKGDGA